MNILMVTLAYEPAVAFGGPVQVVKNNARELVRRGHNVTVFCTNRLDLKRKISPKTSERVDQGVRVVYFNTWYIPGWPGNFGPYFSPQMVSYLRKEDKKYDIIHLNEARTFATIAAARYAQAAGIPYIIQAHGSFARGLRFNKLKDFYDWLVGRRINKKVAQAIALSVEEVSECIAAGVPREKISVVNNGINLADWRKSGDAGKIFRSKFGIPEDASLILFLSRIEEKKGPDLLVEAFAQLDIPDTFCVIAGSDDGFLKPVKNLVSKYGLSDQVIFTGLLKDDDIKAAYDSADVFVLPSRFDTFPMAVVEALSSGIPVVITETCQIAELIEDRAGLVVKVDPASIVDGLRKLLSDRSMRDAYAKGASKLAEEAFSIQSVVDRIEKIYQGVLLNQEL